ncbi:DUF4388 domain-containing protein [Acidobacteriota bacterium]
MNDATTWTPEGAITPTNLPQIFRIIVCEHKTCMLFLQKEEIYKAIYFDEGSVVYAESNQKEESLNFRLLDLSAVDLNMLEDVMKQVQANRGLAKVLVEKDILNESQVADIMKPLIADIVIRVFDWTSGHYMVQEVGSLYGKETYTGISTMGVILEGVRRMFQFEEIMDQMLKNDTPLKFSDDPHIGHQKLALEPAEGFILSRVDGHSTVRDICAVSMLSEEMTCRVIYGLICGGLLKLGDPAVKSEKKDVSQGTFRVEKVSQEEFDARKEVSEKVPYLNPPPVPRPIHPGAEQADAIVEELAKAAAEASSTTTATGSTPASSQAGPGGSKYGVYGAQRIEVPQQGPVAGQDNVERSWDPSHYTAAQQEILMELDTLYPIIDQANYYSILGVSRDAPQSMVTDAFTRLSDRYHPNQHPWLYDPELKTKFAYVYAKMSRAHSILMSDRERIEYDEQLRRDERSQVSTELKIRREFLKTDRQREVATARADGEAHYKKSVEHFNHQHFHDAMEECRKALKNYDLDARYHNHLGIILMKNPKLRWQKEAEQHFRKAIELDPWQAEYAANLASLYRGAGMSIKARKMYIKTLELDPNHAEALEEVPVEERPKPKLKELSKEPEEDLDGIIE